MSTVLCVTGMHRSGTSLLAGWLERCGLAIHNGRVLGPHTGNPKGHFEDLDFYDLQSAANLRLDQASSGWKLWGVEPGALDDDHLAAALSLIEQRNLKFPAWGWKDPRSVIYLDQWKRLIPGLKVLLLWRPCAEVVASLVSRSGKSPHSDIHIELNGALKLWSDYSARMCAYKDTHAADTVLCNVHSALRHDRELLQELNDQLGLTLDYVPLAGLFNPSIFGRQPGPVAEAVSAREDVRLLHEELVERSSLGVPAGPATAPETVPGSAVLQELLDDVSAMLGKRDARLHSLARQVRDLEFTVQQERARIEEGLQAAASLARQVRDHESTIQEQRAEIEGVLQQVASLRARLRQMDAAERESQLAAAAQQDVMRELTAELERLRSHPLYRAYERAKRLVAGGGRGQ